MRRLTLSLTAIAAAPLAMAAPAAAQEPSKQETIDWLMEKIPEASLGCRRIVSDTYYGASTTHYKNELVFKGSFSLPTYRIEGNQVYETGRRAGETTKGTDDYTFRPTSVEAVEIVQPENQRFEDGTTAVGTCYGVKLSFSTRVVRDDDPSQSRRSLSFEVSDRQLAVRIKRAVEHWIALEKSGEGEPF